MRSKILLSFARFAYRYPWIVAAALAVATIVATVYAARLRMDYDWTKFLPPESEAALANEVVREAFPQTFDTILIALEADKPGQQALLTAAADQLAKDLRDANAAARPPFLVDVDYKTDEEMQGYFGNLGDPRLLALLDERKWAAIQADLTEESLDRRLDEAKAAAGFSIAPDSDPLGILDEIRADLIPHFGPVLFPQHEGYSISADGRILVLSVRPTRPSSDILFAHHTVRQLERTAKATLKALGPPIRGHVFASFAG
ncbi:MAG: hypothetical protein NTW86_24090, partial [Candidatus Sumerlaeota bacterium]|nr:hypothetical protein [Candidatus Sumerlaeota bacterium]